MKKLTEEQLNDLKYFWQYKGDLERYSSFEKLIPILKRDYPEIISSWNSYKGTIKILDLIMENVELKE